MEGSSNGFWERLLHKLLNVASSKLLQLMFAGLRREASKRGESRKELSSVKYYSTVGVSSKSKGGLSFRYKKGKSLLRS